MAVNGRALSVSLTKYAALPRKKLKGRPRPNSEPEATRLTRHGNPAVGTIRSGKCPRSAPSTAVVVVVVMKAGDHMAALAEVIGLEEARAVEVTTDDEDEGEEVFLTADR